jgi:hypothetical protein
MEESEEKELVELGDELHSIFWDTLADISKTEKNRLKAVDKTFEALSIRIGYEEKRARWKSLIARIDRINIAECAYPDKSHFLYQMGLWAQEDHYKYLADKQKRYEMWLDQQEEKADRFFEEKKLEYRDTESEVTLSYIYNDMPTEFTGDTLIQRGKEIIQHRADMAAINYYNLSPPFVRREVKIPGFLKDLHAESRWCYVLQLYRAAVSLCRSVIELSLKHKAGIDIESSIGSMGKYLDSSYYNMHIISKDAHRIGHEVRMLANKVMHVGKTIQKPKALEAIEKTKTFLEDLFGVARS